MKWIFAYAVDCLTYTRSCRCETPECNAGKLSYVQLSYRVTPVLGSTKKGNLQKRHHDMHNGICVRLPAEARGQLFWDVMFSLVGSDSLIFATDLPHKLPVPHRSFWAGIHLIMVPHIEPPFVKVQPSHNRHKGKNVRHGFTGRSLPLWTDQVLSELLGPACKTGMPLRNKN